MATDLRTQIHLEVASLLQASSPVEGAAGGRIQKILNLTNGTSSGQADKVYFADRTLGDASNEVLDLAGVLADPLGATLTFAKVKLVAISNPDTTDGDNLEVGPDATNGWGAGGYVKDASDRRIVPASGVDIWYDPNGHAVGAGSTDEINVATAVGGMTYRVLIVGTSA